MNKITFPIKRDQRGIEVVNLQQGLLLLLRQNIFGFNANELPDVIGRLREEQVDKKYGGTTLKLIERFQELHHLQSTGKVDRSTARVLNEVLGKLGAFDKPSSARLHIVAGQVLRENGKPYSGSLVRALHKDNQGLLRLGEEETDSDGFYTIRYDASPIEGAVNLFVAALDADGRSVGESDIREKAGTRETLDITVPAVDTQTYQIEGKVHSRLSAAIGGLRVVVVDKRVGGDVELTTTETNESGSYQTSFNDESLRQSGKDLPDLQARVFREDKFLGASEVRYNASTRETLNVLLNEKSNEALQSEIETLTGSLAKHVQGNLRDLKENDDQQDITYLANKTGWDARAVALAALADKFGESSTASGNGIETPFFYALFRAGLPANEDALYQTDSETVEKIWKQSIEKGVIPKAQQDKLPEAMEKFQRLAANHALEGPASIGVSHLKDMLAVSIGDDAQEQQKFAEIHTRHKNDFSRFWGAVRGEFGEDKEKRLRLDGQLAYLTLNNAPLVQKLHTQAGGNGLTNSVELVGLGFHNTEKWKDVVGDLDVPKEIKGAKIAERRANYAEVQAAQIRLSFPTAVVAQMVKDGETPLLNGSADSVHEFLMDHQGSFEIGRQPFAQYIRKNNLRVDAEVNKEITRIQRVYQITPGDEAMNAMLSKGVDSASAVVRYGKDTFIKLFKDDVGGEKNAKLIHAKAQQVHNTVLNIALNYLTSSVAPGIGNHSPSKIIKPAPVGPTPDNADDVIAYSTLENLFGEMDYCECDHCRSVLSPAAYMVDLFQFIYSDESLWNAFLETWKKEHANAPYPFVDQASWAKFQSDWNAAHPGQSLPNTMISPFEVLMQRRPDIQHIPLTCENTNTPLPYIDIVNEVLEHYVINGLSLAGYQGHDISNEITSAELLANPQFVSDRAYEVLAGKIENPGDLAPLLPPAANLPFHRPLENMRRYFNKFDIPLPQVMQALRKSDDLDRGSNEYGWRDIWMEELLLSRAEYQRLTDHSVGLKQLYGFPPTITDAEAVDALSNAKAFTQRMEISYEDLVEILRTRFINPHSILIPKLEKLGISLATIKDYKDGAITDEALKGKLSPQIDESKYDGDVLAWLKGEENYANIMSLILLSSPDAPDEVCSFDTLKFRYADPDKIAVPVNEIDFFRLLRFIRLWKKLGWSIEQTDKTMTALYPDSPSGNTDVAKLDEGFLILLPRLGVLKQVMDKLKLKPKRDLLHLLACFAPIGTEGYSSLYRTMFLSATMLKLDAVFADDGYGNFLSQDPPEKLLAHTEALREAFKLTGDELAEITTSLGFDKNTPLTLEHISQIFRRGWLARKLKLSSRELNLLCQVSGIDPFAPPDLGAVAGQVLPPMLRLLELRQLMQSASIKPHEVLYLMWDKDISQQSSPEEETILHFARAVREGLATVESELVVTDDPTGEIARERMTQVYGDDAGNLFFGLLDSTFITEITYDHHQSELEPAILTSGAGHLAYDDLRKTLTWFGVLDKSRRDKLKVGVTAFFDTAIDDLFAENQKTVAPFFDTYPELQPLHSAYVFFGELGSIVSYAHTEEKLSDKILGAASGRLKYDHDNKLLTFKGVLDASLHDVLKGIPGVSGELQAAIDNLFNANQSAITNFFNEHPSISLEEQEAYKQANDNIERRRSRLLEQLLPELKQRRKQQYTLQVISGEAKVDSQWANAILQDTAVLHEVDGPENSALFDFTAVADHGLSARVFFSDSINDASANADYSSDSESNLVYALVGNNPLPLDPADPDSPISGIWSGYIQVPENGFYNFYIEADTGAKVTLSIKNEAIPLGQNGKMWSNQTALEFTAGRLYKFTLAAKRIRESLRVRWQSFGQGRSAIPPRFLYSSYRIDNIRKTYIRFFKILSLAEKLGFGHDELSWFAAHDDYKINGDAWLNSLPVDSRLNQAISQLLFKTFVALLKFARMKKALSPEGNLLLEVLKNPYSIIDDNKPGGDENSKLLALTRWNPVSLDDLLVHWGKTTTSGDADRAKLKDLVTFYRVFEVQHWIPQIGIPTSVLIKVATNEPSGESVRDFQKALRARYNESDWIKVIQPINDELRAVQRDALVAYILHQMRSKPESEHINTAEKLFEYFLMDVQMQPCTITSRIRHALSTIQLFIDRCLMNLEPDVSPASIKAEQWQWRNRYRVWEANRKVFLWPENWLEPELRDDQSPFFKETMSELLQSDITEERATTALLNYLQKLDEVAKLEPCGMHYVENDPGANDDIAHVVARTSGAKRKYFYRRREYGYWTPWEHIKLDIEDNPVIPVLWKGRLFLFWLRILKEAKLEMPNNLPDDPMDDVSAKQIADRIPGAGKIDVKAILCWSEFYDNKWQSTNTSEIDRPLTLVSSIKPGEFDRSKLKLSALEWTNGLRVIVSNQIGVGSSFLLYNVHSSPESRESKKRHFPPKRSIYRETKTLSIAYLGKKAYHDVFENNLTGLSHKVVEANHIVKGEAWDIPFFYEDKRHVFWVSTSRQMKKMQGWTKYLPDQIPKLPEVFIHPIITSLPAVLPLTPPVLNFKSPGFGVYDPSPIELIVSEDAYINRGLGSMGTISYEGREIGLIGSEFQFGRGR